MMFTMAVWSTTLPALTAIALITDNSDGGSTLVVVSSLLMITAELGSAARLPVCNSELWRCLHCLQPYFHGHLAHMCPARKQLRQRFSVMMVRRLCSGCWDRNLGHC
uniref:Putative secreted protein n=1 Tax=Anopheles darlingi TaxID=43151 RepID=A0A2M4D1B2_ANODA